MTVMAAMRDASWFARPGTKARVYHVIGENGLAACGAPTLLVTDSAIPAGKVVWPLRCRRPGCKKAFEEMERCLKR